HPGERSPVRRSSRSDAIGGKVLSWGQSHLSWARLTRPPVQRKEAPMPLSEYEQRMLAQMEEQLHADDPRLAEALGEPGGPDLRKVALGSLVAIVGIGALVGGVAQGWIWLGVLGFVAMAGGLLLALSPSNGKPSGS